MCINTQFYTYWYKCFLSQNVLTFSILQDCTYVNIVALRSWSKTFGTTDFIIFNSVMNF